MAGIDRWLHYTVTTIDRFHCSSGMQVLNMQINIALIVLTLLYIIFFNSLLH